MFKARSFRQRLLRWFVAYSLVGLVMAGLSGWFLDRWIRLSEEIQKVETAESYLHRAVESQYKFFSYGTKDTEFFRQEKEDPRMYESDFLNEYKRNIENCRVFLHDLDIAGESEFSELIRIQNERVDRIDSLFFELVELIHKRGYKDDRLVGKMRRDAHWLQDVAEIEEADLLTLRRHEKDFIIRNQEQYKELFLDRAGKIRSYITRSPAIPRVRKDTIIARLDRYQDSFLYLVELDQRIGIKDNTSLKAQLDGNIEETERTFTRLFGDVHRWYKVQQWKLYGWFGLIALGLFVFSLLLSKLLSRRITRPLEELTHRITLFVESNFELDADIPLVRTRDEIGRLTENFSHLKDEVIKWLKYFKQKVDERTRELAEANARLRRISEANSRFVPDEFLHQMEKKGIEDVRLGDHVARTMTVLFADIRDFTEISEAMSPRENFEFINKYLEGIVPIIQGRGGFIDKFIGDTVMALFPESPDQAVWVCFEMLEHLESFNRERQSEGKVPIRIGCGLHTGGLILGTIGHENRLETTVISDAVNTAARIESLTKHYGAPVLITGETLKALVAPAKFTYRFIDRLRVKGKQQWVSVYEFLPPWERLKRGYLREYEDAVRNLKTGEVSEANIKFEILSSSYPTDRAVSFLKERCSRFLNGDRRALEGIVEEGLNALP